MPTKKKTAMTAEHKAALAEGRELSRAVRDYLEALEANRPTRGRKVTPESIRKRLTAIDSQIDAAAPLKRVNLIQERIDLEDRLDAMETVQDLAPLEKAFIKAAKKYSKSKGITYAAWREIGVAPSVLTAAGISRTFQP